MDIDKAPLKMVVVDGCCFGPKHCAYEIVQKIFTTIGCCLLCSTPSKLMVPNAMFATVTI